MSQTKYRNLAFWAWNGSMGLDEVKQQIHGFHQQGFGGFFIHARAGLTIPYMGSHWMNACQAAIEEAKKLNLDVWFYDEDGWPSGFAGGKVNHLGENYQIKRLYLSNDLNIEVNPHQIIGYYQNQDGEIQQVFDKKDATFVIYYRADAYYVDVLNPEVTKAFIKYTHDVYKKNFGQYFQTVVKGIFTDEPQVFGQGLAYSPTIKETFKKLHGYDMETYLYTLFMDDENGQAFRHDYFQTLNHCFSTNYIDILSAWCDEAKIALTGHFSAEDGLSDQAASNGGVMAMYPAMQIPGIDFLGRRLPSPVLLKQVGSIRNQYQKPFILSETFGCSGWNTTFAQLSWLWGYQAAHGVNLACLHISTYSIKGIRKRDYPAFFSYQEPWWNQFHYLSNWMNQLNRLLSDGNKTIDVLVLNPIKAAWTHRYLSNPQRHISNQYRTLLEALDDIQVLCDIADETLLEKDGTIENNKIKLKASSYRMLIVPEMDSLTKHTHRFILEWMKTDGTVIFTNQLPKWIEGKEQINWDVLSEKPTVVMNRTDLWRKHFEWMEYQREIVLVDVNNKKPSDDLALSVIHKDDATYAYVLNKSAHQTKTLLGIYYQNADVLQMQIDNENKTRMATNQYQGKTNFSFVIEPMQSILFKFVSQTSLELKERPIKQKIYYDQVTIIRNDPNALTVDTCQFQIKGEPLSERLPVLKAADTIYAEVNQRKQDLEVVVYYQFETKYIPNSLSLHIESEHSTKITLNDVPIEKTQDAYFVDKAIHTFAVSHATKIGLNRVAIHYVVPYMKKDYNIEDVYETERNRFYYPVEIESIYVTGDFDLNYLGGTIEKEGHYRLNNGLFVLNKPSDITNYQDFTNQHMWFYRGSIDLLFTYNKTDSKGESWLKLSQMKAPLVEVFVNDQLAGAIYLSPYEMNISALAKLGMNQIRLRVYGSNRNLLGPHHHYKGEPNFVGVSTFKGVQGFEDFIHCDVKPSTWHDGYDFVPYGIDTIVIIEKDEITKK